MFLTLKMTDIYKYTYLRDLNLKIIFDSPHYQAHYIYAFLYISDTPAFSICNLEYSPVDGFLGTAYLESSIVRPSMATRFALPPLYTLQAIPLLSNPHCRAASPSCTTHTGVGFDTLMVQLTLPRH